MVTLALAVGGLSLSPLADPGLASANTTTTTTSGPTTSTTSTTTTSTTTTTMATTTTSTTTTVPTTRTQTNLVWPSMGSAAFAIPQLQVGAASPSQRPLPIASLTKMMTMWIVLHEYPISNSNLGACETVNAHDMVLYRQDVAQQQSLVQIAKNQHICERTLLRGIIVHSAGDYAQLLAQLTHLSTPQFVALMNRDAAKLGMLHTHYVDETGIGNGDVSTAQDQTILTVALMTNEPVVRSIAVLTRVWLPVQGVVGTFTPDLGVDGVVGVKSGYTYAAGGCDAMAVNLKLGAATITTYIVVLGQQSSSALALSGQVALALYHSLRPSIARVVTPTGVHVEWVGSTSDLVGTTSSSPS